MYEQKDNEFFTAGRHDCTGHSFGRGNLRVTWRSGGRPGYGYKEMAKVKTRRLMET